MFVGNAQKNTSIAISYQPTELENNILNIAKEIKLLDIKKSDKCLDPNGGRNQTAKFCTPQDSLNFISNQPKLPTYNILKDELYNFSRNLIINEWQFSISEINEIFGLNKEPLIECALLLINIRMTQPAKIYQTDFPNIGLNHIAKTELNSKTMAKTSTSNISGEDVLFCAAVALGADFLYGTTALGNAGDKWTKKAIVKAFGKIATRMLGPIGTAITVGTFGMCLWEKAKD